MNQKIKLIIKNTKKWMSDHKSETFWLALIILMASFMRLYKIDEYMTFLGDEGRDVLIVRRLLVDFDPILVGPGTSIGNMYLGPLYYYLIAPALLVAGLSPIGPAVLIALLGIITVWFVWYVIRTWFPLRRRGSGGQASIHSGALVGALLYAIAPTIIIYSRSSWNPNIMPIFSLLAVFSLWKAIQEDKNGWLVVMAIALAFVLQSHYLGLILFPLIAFYWVIKVFDLKRHKKALSGFMKSSIQGAFAFLFLMSPLVIFDARHGWRNFEAMKVFFTERQTTVSARPWTAIPKLWDLMLQVNSSILGAKNETVGLLVTVAFILFSLFFVYALVFQRKRFNHIFEYSILVLWILISLLGFGVYKQHIYDHYFGFLYPALIILFSVIFHSLWRSGSRIIKIGLSVLLVFIVYTNLLENPLKFAPNRQYDRSVTVSEKMIEESKGEPFNMAVIAERNYEGAYLYHLERVRANFVIIDPQRADATITKQLFVVCELPRDECDPTHNDKAEVAGFGWSAIESEWEVFGTTLFKLVHSDGVAR